MTAFIRIIVSDSFECGVSVSTSVTGFASVLVIQGDWTSLGLYKPPIVLLP